MLDSKQKSLALPDLSCKPLQPQPGNLSLAAKSLLAGGRYLEHQNPLDQPSSPCTISNRNEPLVPNYTFNQESPEYAPKLRWPRWIG